jgi:hypothetical protein
MNHYEFSSSESDPNASADQFAGKSQEKHSKQRDDECPFVDARWETLRAAFDASSIDDLASSMERDLADLLVRFESFESPHSRARFLSPEIRKR